MKPRKGDGAGAMNGAPGGVADSEHRPLEPREAPLDADDHAHLAARARPGELVVTLRDGSRATVRPICPEDAEPLRAGFERLSQESRYRRFLAPMQRLTGAMLRYLTDVDHHDHEALVAVGADGTLIGVARFVRRPSDPEAAEVAVTVADDHQGRGLGTALLGLLADRARAEGIRRFIALMLADNREMLELIEDLGPARTIEQAAGTVELETTLPLHGTGPHLGELLRGSASGRYQVIATAPESLNS
jgi:protein lysine acetyltransferase